MMKNYIKIFAATLLLLGSCKTQKPVGQNSVSQAPVEIIQPKADSINYNYPPPRNYSVPKKIFKELENYETAFEELKAMLEGKIEPNFERAVFVSENPFYSNKYNYAEFQKIVDIHLYFVNQIIRATDKSDSIDFNVKVNQYGRFNLDDIRHMPDEKKTLYKKTIANRAVFTYITDTVNIFPFFHKPFTYATHDPFGIKNWSNSQVINLLYSQEQKGNCFALTALYKILSNRLHADARICTAPQHIYIQHRDKKGDYYNVELATAGHPGDGTIQTLTHTTTEAIKSGIALRSFDAKQSIGLCIVNLAKSYEHKFGSKDDDFLLKCAELVLKHDPLNLSTLLLKQQILDVRVTSFAIENNISDINKLKVNAQISQTVFDLENHTALLYRLGYRQMPYDMQEIIMTGIFPKDFKDKNPNPFTTIDPKDEHRKSFKTLYGGLFQEVFEIREFEPYGHFTFQTTTNKITVFDTTAQTGFLIDPVAFAYDFGARMYDARLGRWLSVDPLEKKYPSMSPYSGMGNNPILIVDVDGRDIYIFVYASKNTESGAGHVSFAVGQDTKNLTYYSHYRKKDGGGKIVSGLSLDELKGNYEKKNFEHGQTEAPVLVLRIKTSPEIDAEMNKSGEENLKSTWTLMSNNCADCTKDAIDKTGLSEGVAFGISTPNELVEDLYENNKKAFKDGTITVVEGDLKKYLETEPNSVPSVIFGKDKDVETPEKK